MVPRVLALMLFAGCEDQIPTLTGADRFPPGTDPLTLEVVVPATDFLTGSTIFGGFAPLHEASFLVVANTFDGALDAHALGRFTSFPDSIMLGDAAVPSFAYSGARLAAAVDSAASFTAGPVRLQVYELLQDWDSTSVTWRFADADGPNPVPWRTPGGTRGELLAETVWTPSDTTAAADTVVWEIPGAAAARLAAPNHPGVLIRSSQPGTRVELRSLGLRVTLIPSSRPDTTVTRTVSRGGETFIFNPPAPDPAGLFRVGGPDAERTVLRFNLSAGVPTCENPQTTAGCARVPIRDVTLNRATLVLEPVAVPLGFRPLTVTPLFVRRVLEPALGRTAALGEAVALDSLPAATFAGGAALSTIDLFVTGAVQNLVATDSATATFALLSEPEGGRFGAAWFRSAPRLRLVYTLPSSPRLR